MTNEKNEKQVVIKAATPSTLKRQFKVLCTQNETTMSKTLEGLIKKWIQDNAPTSNFPNECSEQKNEDLKVYIPESLKTEFKVLCIQKQVTMRSTLCNLIHEWVEIQTNLGLSE